MESQEVLILFALGVMLLIGLACDRIGKTTPIPRVSLLLLSGLTIGPHGLDLIPQLFIDSWFEVITGIALALIGFLIGAKLSPDVIESIGSKVLFITLGVVCFTVVIVSASLYFAGVPIVPAVLLSTVAIATAPAATMDVVEEIAADNTFSRMLLGVVAIDDALGLILFSLATAFGFSFGTGDGVGGSLLFGVWEVFGACVVGALFGGIMLQIKVPDSDVEAVQAKALGMVFLCAGAAIWMKMSYILAAIVLGFFMGRSSNECKLVAAEVKRIEWPFIIIFFILAGASLDLRALLLVGWIGPLYIISRIVSRVSGGWLGARIGGCGAKTCGWIGMSLMPQAGVAIGMALMADQQFPQYNHIILPVALGGTVFFELTGPFCTRVALRHADE